MNIRHDPDIGPGAALPIEAFLAWIERQDAKYEYDRGTIGMMVENTRDHAILVARFVFALMTRLDRSAFDVVSEGFGVRVADSVRYPDVLVQARETDGKARRSTRPRLIVEVLSPSSRHLDMEVKRREYTGIESLSAYVVASQDEPKIWLWARGSDGAFPGDPSVCHGGRDELRLDALGVTLSLAELYLDDA